jgi:C4-type Zn-finger protein
MDPPSEMTTFFIALFFVPDAHIELLNMIYCPVCKSRDIFPVAGGYMGQVYLCKSCKYRGSFVLDVDEEKDADLKEK